METTSKNNSSVGWVYGLIAGLAMVVFTLLMYIGGVEAYMGSQAYLGYLVIIAIAVLGGLRQKKLNGGYLSMSEGLKVVFTIFALGFLLQTIFSHILLNYIDVSFRDALTQAGIEKMIEIMKRFGASQSNIDEAIKKANDPQNNSFFGILFNYCIVCVIFL
ncbi:DUF4199 domain-containing protein [Paraflavitalea speifideaquila]|uniref:DUF4199 domain-containing protein n=1 Tax=Paraflavitalea speifideaquila TaxID=3076558 RepID=UPI0028EF48FC|nr:DUF4199 domain-containing protein [Paraflavitalea speifideiaquila]